MNESRYDEARQRLNDIIDITGFGGTIRVRKADLIAILGRLDAVELDAREGVAQHAHWQERAERAEQAIVDALESSDYLPDGIRIWDSAAAADILEAARKHAEG